MRLVRTRLRSIYLAALNVNRPLMGEHSQLYFISVPQMKLSIFIITGAGIQAFNVRAGFVYLLFLIVYSWLIINGFSVGHCLFNQSELSIKLSL